MCRIYKSLSEQTPAEIDTQLFPILYKIGVALDRINSTQEQIRYYTHDAHGRECREVPANLAKLLENLRESLKEVQAEAAPFEGEYKRRGGWSRVFHVVNGDGHTHSSMRCQTCRMTTLFSRRPELSGLNKDEIIAAIGETACTVCYPDAPLNPDYIKACQRSAEEKERIAQEKREQAAARQAEKEVKGITAPDGSILIVGGEKIRTHHAAKTALTDNFENEMYQAIYIKQMPNYVVTPQEIENRERHRKLLAEAIAHKEGKPVETVLAEARKRAEKRMK